VALIHKHDLSLVDRHIIKFDLKTRTMSQEWPGIFLDAHDVKLFDKSRGKDWRVTRVH